MASFSKKHYEAVAAVLKSERPAFESLDEYHTKFDDIALALAKMFKKDNAQFNVDKFHSAIYS